MTFKELLSSMKALGVTVAVKDGRPVLRGANIPECLRRVVGHYRDDLLRHHGLSKLVAPPPVEAPAHLAVQPDAPPAGPTPFPRQAPRPSGTRVPCPQCNGPTDRHLCCHRCSRRVCLYCHRMTPAVESQLCWMCREDAHPEFPCDQARNDATP